MVDPARVLDDVVDKLLSKYGDVDLANAVGRVRLAFIASEKRVRELEMMLVNEKKQYVEDPLICHAMHFKT